MMCKEFVVNMSKQKTKFVSHLTAVLEAAGVDPYERSFTTVFSKRYDVSPQAVRDWFSPEKSFPKTETLNKIALDYKTTIDYLLNGNENISSGPEVKGEIPVLGVAPAGAFRHIKQLKEWEIEEYKSSTYKQNGYRFFLRIEGDSMDNPVDRHHLPEGSLVLFNAENTDPPSGSVVLAKVSGHDEVTCKRIAKDAGNIWLEPVNPRYPLIDKSFRILATAEETTRRL